MALVGGGALLRKIDQLITKETGVAAYVAEAPMACVAMGAGKALENYAIIRRSIGGL
jgi:rod shape-determining protein MreB